MAIASGYSRYACDCAACSKVNYDVAGGQYAARYVTREWTDANGQQRTVVLCTDHSAVLTDILERHDAELAAFMKSGADPSASGGE